MCIPILRYFQNLRILKGVLLFGILLISNACENIYEEPTDNIDEAADLALNIHAPIGLFEMVHHVSDEMLSRGLFQQNTISLGQEIGAEIRLLDSVFSDDDSIIYEINFDTEIPSSFDLKERTGQIQVVVYVDYTEAGSVQQVRIDNQKPYQVKLNNGYTQTVRGSFKMVKTLDQGQRFLLDSISLLNSENPEIEFNALGYLEFKSISGQSTPGLKGDMVEIQGEGKYVTQQQILDWEIILPLRMRYEFGCSEYVHKGMIRLLTGVDRYTIDYDPFGTGACNRIVKITKGGNQFEVILP